MTSKTTSENKVPAVAWVLLVLSLVAAITVGIIVFSQKGDSSTDVNPGSLSAPTTDVGQGQITLYNKDGAVSVATAKEDVPDSNVVLDVYLDYRCSYCGMFELQGGGQVLSDLVLEQNVVVNMHLLNFLNASSSSKDYSSRAASVSLLVAERHPDKWFDFNQALFATSPADPEAGLTGDEFLAAASSVGIDDLTTQEVDSTQFFTYLDGVTAEAMKTVEGTPTVLINGTASETIMDAEQFSAEVSAAATE